jgi:hypothetical protein
MLLALALACYVKEHQTSRQQSGPSSYEKMPEPTTIVRVHFQSIVRATPNEAWSREAALEPFLKIYTCDYLRF